MARYILFYGLMLFTLFFINPSAGITAVPETINYQGKIVKTDGTPLDGYYMVNFSICDQIASGNCPWTEQQIVIFSDGVFNVQLGSVISFPQNLFEINQLYLEVEFFNSGSGWETFSPRKLLTAVPFARKSALADDVHQKDINPKSVSISGYGLVIDNAGNWVGKPSGLVGPQGPSGISCWDLNGNGNCDLATDDKDSSGSCDALDCKGDQGSSGVYGISCWDINGNGNCDLASEDKDNSGSCDALDCKGEIGAQGEQGLISLISIIDEPTGANCSWGGKKISVGLDNNKDGILNQGEVTKNEFFCYQQSVEGFPVQRSNLQYGWTKNFGSSSDDDIKDMDVDSQGNLYLVGTSTGNSADILIRKYSSQGGLLWTKTIGGTSWDMVTAIKYHTQTGTLLIGGAFSGSVDFGVPKNTFSSARERPFLLFLNSSDGGFQKVYTLSPPNESDLGGGGIADITIDDSGNILYCGLFGRQSSGVPNVTLDFNPGTGINNIQPVGYADLFVSKLDASGNYLWTYTYGMANRATIGISLQASGNNIYVLGKTYSSSLFLVQLDQTGTQLNNKPLLSDMPVSDVSGLIVDSNGSIYISAIIGSNLSLTNYNVLPSSGQTDFLIRKYDNSLNLLWTYYLGGWSTDGAYSIALDSSGDIYAVGEFTNDINFNSSLTNQDIRVSKGNSKDIFVLKINAAGTYQWAETLGSYGQDRAQRVLINGDNIYFAGYFSNGLDFDWTLGFDNHGSNGTYDAFVTKYTGITN